MRTGNKAPEPSEADIARAAVATALEVFNGSDGRLTVAYYRRLCALGPHGVIAMNLFRASKTSTRAKQYRGHRYRGASYEVKNYSLDQLCKAMGCSCGADRTGPSAEAHSPECPTERFSWGWKRDPATPGYEWVLYVELPEGQVSFHSATRGAGPDYAGDFDGQFQSTERVLAFCDELARKEPHVVSQDKNGA